MNFGMIILNQSTRAMRNYVAWMQIVLLLILKQKMFIKVLLIMLRKDLLHQIMK